ncbi:MAG: DUF3800 domain-containing protein [Candidatus Leucobacter sulfamidivorax]|nr:DUF3800 domain-containing protein [Candidatus Leucobacter sulfamidivorax]
MKICYIDESGGTEPPESSASATPLLALTAVIIDSSDLPALTRDYVSLKCRHFPGSFVSGKSLDHILTEIKGSKIQALTRSESRNDRRKADRYRDEALSIVEHYGCRMMGKVWVKSDGSPLDIRKTYGYGVQDIVKGFQRYLAESDDHGVVIADSREHKSNLQVAHSVFTQKWKSGGDAYPQVAEVPIFAASDNHAGLQVADLLASCFLFPMAVSAFAPERPGFTHNPSAYHHIRKNFGARIKALQYRYTNRNGIKSGGLDIRSFRGPVRPAKIFKPPT